MMKKYWFPFLIFAFAGPILADTGIMSMGTPPGGSAGDVQFKKTGSFGGDSTFNFSTATKKLKVTYVESTSATFNTAVNAGEYYKNGAVFNPGMTPGATYYASYDNVKAATEALTNSVNGNTASITAINASTAGIIGRADGNAITTTGFSSQFLAVAQATATSEARADSNAVSTTVFFVTLSSGFHSGSSTFPYITCDGRFITNLATAAGLSPGASYYIQSGTVPTGGVFSISSGTLTSTITAGGMVLSGGGIQFPDKSTLYTAPIAGGITTGSTNTWSAAQTISSGSFGYITSTSGYKGTTKVFFSSITIGVNYDNPTLTLPEAFDNIDIVFTSSGMVNTSSIEPVFYFDDQASTHSTNVMTYQSGSVSRTGISNSTCVRIMPSINPAGDIGCFISVRNNNSRRTKTGVFTAYNTVTSGSHGFFQYVTYAPITKITFSTYRVSWAPQAVSFTYRALIFIQAIAWNDQ